jgi:hypothetical protein
LRRNLVLMFMSLTLAACGGGGGGDDGGGTGGGGGGGGGGTNGAPTVSTSSFNVNRNTDLSATITATDPENDTVTFAKTGDPANGQIIAFQANGAFTYRPANGFQGTDSFTITASDPTHQVAATITITVVAVNQAPVAADDIVTVSGTTATIDVLANDSDPEGDALSIVLEGSPTAGTASVVNGKVELTLPANFAGFTRFQYRAQDGAGLGTSAMAAVFVDTQRVRLVYDTNEGDGIRNLYVNDLARARKVSALTSASTTFLGNSNVSANGRTVVWEEATGDFTPANYRPQSIWTVPADGSSPPRKISPALQANELLNVRSPLSADGQWIVYGVTTAGVETLYLANLLPGGTSVVIPVPAGASRIESIEQSLIFGPTSQYTYFTAVMNAGGQVAYRVSVADPAAPVQLSAAPTPDRKVAIRLVSNDDTKAVQVAVTGAGPTAVANIALINTSAPGNETTLSHAFVAGDALVRIVANETLSTVSYIVFNSVATDFKLYCATTQPVATGQLVTDIEYDFVQLSPEISAISASGDEVLVATQIAVSGVQTERLLQIALTPGATPAVIQDKAPGFNMYRYADTSQSITYSANPGVAILARGQPVSSAQFVTEQNTAYYELSTDNQLIAFIGTNPAGTAPQHLFLASRGGGTQPLQITGLNDGNSFVRTARVAPVN